VYKNGRNTQFRKVWEVPTRKRRAKESLNCYQSAPEFAEVGGFWRILGKMEKSGRSRPRSALSSRKLLEQLLLHVQSLG